MPAYTLQSITRWPENEYEGSAFVHAKGLPDLEARVLVSKDAAWAEWQPGRVVLGEVILLRVGAIEHDAGPPRVTHVGRASYEAVGRVLHADEDHVVLDVGFPLEVDLDGDQEAFEEGDALRVHGQLQMDGAPLPVFGDGDLRWADLRGLDLTDAPLDRLDLTGADLRGAKVNVSRLATCRLQGTRLEGIVGHIDTEVLRQIQLLWDDPAAWNDYRTAVRPEPMPWVCFRGADLGVADLTGMLFSGDLSGADLSRCRLDRTELLRADLRGARLAGGELLRVDLDGANLAGADLSGARLRHCRLVGANLAGANLSGTTFHNVRVAEANLSGADLSGATFDACDLVEVDLSGATLTGARFTGCDLSFATGDLTAAALTDCER